MGKRLVEWYDGDHFTGVMVAKWFNGVLYHGQVQYDDFYLEGPVRTQLWRIRYTDKDEEDLVWEELWTSLVVFHLNHMGKIIGGTHIGRRVAKWFDGVLHFGMVTRSVAAVGADDTPLWRIRYTDNDEEDFDADDLQTGLTLYQYETEGCLIGPFDPPGHTSNIFF